MLVLSTPIGWPIFLYKSDNSKQAHCNFMLEIFFRGMDPGYICSGSELLDLQVWAEISVYWAKRRGFDPRKAKGSFTQQRKRNVFALVLAI